MQATSGVLPLPPTRRLPTLITGRLRRRRRVASAAYHCRRHAAAAPYIELSRAITVICSVRRKAQ
jgi:hypothetical protein